MHKLFVSLLMMASITVLGQQDDKVFVFLNSKLDKAKISEDSAARLQNMHMSNIERMVEEKQLVVAGPFEGGGGIFIFNTADVVQAKKWLQSDPAVRANRWNIEYFRIDFIKGGACLAQPPYEMVIYNFDRINYINDIANYKMNSSDAAAWQEVSRVDSVLMVGRFPLNDGGIIIYSSEIEPEMQKFFSTDQVAFDKKKIWVAQGSFCEN